MLSVGTGGPSASLDYQEQLRKSSRMRTYPAARLKVHRIDVAISAAMTQRNSGRTGTLEQFDRSGNASRKLDNLQKPPHDLRANKLIIAFWHRGLRCPCLKVRGQTTPYEKAIRGAGSNAVRDRLLRRPRTAAVHLSNTRELFPVQQPEAFLLRQLQALEVALHQPAVRGDRARLSALLHEEFREVGRSGAVYSKADVLTSLPAAVPHAPVIADDFLVRSLAANVALLTYRSVHALADGTLHGHALRSSIWQFSDAGWQMSFHQGTPTEPYKPR